MLPVRGRSPLGSPLGQNCSEPDCWEPDYWEPDCWEPDYWDALLESVTGEPQAPEMAMDSAMELDLAMARAMATESERDWAARLPALGHSQKTAAPARMGQG